MDRILQLIKDHSHRIEDDRTRSDIFLCAGEEIGELALEVKIANGRSYKEAGVDGIIGESIDVAINCFDMIFQECPDITEEELFEFFAKKCGKWEEKVNERLAKQKSEINILEYPNDY